MTEPNVVRTRRQRIEIGNPGTWSGPLPVRYSKSKFFFSKCVAIYIYILNFVEEFKNTSNLIENHSGRQQRKTIFV